MATTPARQYSSIQEDILRSVCYSDVFNFPLKQNEIFENSRIHALQHEIEEPLAELLSQKILKKHNEFYMLWSTDITCVERRIAAEHQHSLLLDKVKKWSRFIVKFPFVKAVCISGSYSKGAMGPDDDIDYFVITERGRLWICRSLLRGFRKFFLGKSGRYMCLNYFLDEGHMSLPDRNIFVAHEIKSLIPVYGMDLFKSFQKENEWATDFLPNKKPVEQILINNSRPFLRRAFETIFSGAFGRFTENMLYRFMLRRRKKRFSHFNEEDFDLNMRTKKNTEKHHPGGTQKKVLNLFSQRLQALGIE